MKEKISNAVEKHRELVFNTLDYIWKNAETGYREEKTSKYMEDAFLKLGYDIVKAENIPGFYTVIDTGREGPEILILGELDSLICHEHPDADPITGAVHCCGHSAQCAALIGIAAALKEPGILDTMCGKIRLCAVPAEEMIEIEYRTSLIEKGIISFLSGKTEFLHRGYFDGVDIAFMVHTSQSDSFSIDGGSVGCISKRIIYKGVSTHAGGSPWDGCNALYAANLGLNAINAIRETFREDDIIRVHPIITKGGSAVNAIPDCVIIESYVRGKNYDAIIKANKKVNRALCGGAVSIGANIEIQDLPGYAPCVNSQDLMQLSKETAEELTGKPFYLSKNIGSGSTDMGDLSMIMPTVHVYGPGATGTSHGKDYYISNPEAACVDSAKFQVMMLERLLSDNASVAKSIIKNFTPLFSSKEKYFEYIEKIKLTGNRIEYNEDNIKINI